MAKKKTTKGAKPESVDFNCSFCGHKWTALSKDFKMSEEKGMAKHWARYYMPCPCCHREVSEVKEMM